MDIVLARRLEQASAFLENSLLVNQACRLGEVEAWGQQGENSRARKFAGRMFQCRMCSGLPFTQIFGSDDPQPTRPEGAKPSGKAKPLRDPSTFEPRNDEEVAALIGNWETYAHPRAREFFPTQDMLEEVLAQIAKGCPRKDDPVLGDDNCVFWYGEVTDNGSQAALRLVKPGEASESTTYVNRVLAFIFATDESFEELMKLPKEPFKMSCGNQLCVNLSHISLQVSPAGKKPDADPTEMS